MGCIISEAISSIESSEIKMYMTVFFYSIERSWFSEIETIRKIPYRFSFHVF